LQVRDHTLEVDVPLAERADPSNPNHLAAPFSGVLTLSVAEGHRRAVGWDGGHTRIVGGALSGRRLLVGWPGHMSCSATVLVVGETGPPFPPAPPAWPYRAS